jgi:hypothetical protein
MSQCPDMTTAAGRVVHANAAGACDTFTVTRVS